jgi:phosphopantetheinyl transferase (holo-ACP synthase)
VIGNDIVDLHLAERESNIHRPRFQDKLFLPHERAMIAGASHPAVILWLLWSCKESVYKIIHRNTRERKFAPQQFAGYIFSCTDTTAAGTVMYQQQTYYFRSHVTGSCIHTCAAGNPALLQEISIFTRYFTSLEDILTGEEIFYKDEDGIPFIRNRYSGESLPVSLSHHGKYIGIAKKGSLTP